MMNLNPIFANKVATVENTDCLIYHNSRPSNRYGSIWYDNTNYSANRLSYIMHKGPIPVGLFVLHRCDRPGCINPDHLFLGTQQDNIKDMNVKGRHTYGVKHARAKLTDTDIIAIREDKRTQIVVGNIYGINPRTVGKIKQRLLWKHVV